MFDCCHESLITLFEIGRDNVVEEWQVPPKKKTKFASIAHEKNPSSAWIFDINSKTRDEPDSGSEWSTIDSSDDEFFIQSNFHEKRLEAIRNDLG